MFGAVLLPVVPVPNNGLLSPLPNVVPENRNTVKSFTVIPSINKNILTRFL